MLRSVLEELIPNELRAALPGRLADVQRRARACFLGFERLMDRIAPPQQTAGALNDIFGYGDDH